MDLSKLPMPKKGFLKTHFLTGKDVILSAKYYARVSEGKVLHEGHPSFVKLANAWLILNEDGDPTVDKPGYYLEAPTPISHTFRSFLNIRFTDYRDWQERGAEVLIPTQDMRANGVHIKGPGAISLRSSRRNLICLNPFQNIRYSPKELTGSLPLEVS